eukprot:Gb_32637 [translate_table: standard]
MMGDKLNPITRALKDKLGIEAEEVGASKDKLGVEVEDVGAPKDEVGVDAGTLKDKLGADAKDDKAPKGEDVEVPRVNPRVKDEDAAVPNDKLDSEDSLERSILFHGAKSILSLLFQILNIKSHFLVAINSMEVAEPLLPSIMLVVAGSVILGTLDRTLLIEHKSSIEKLSELIAKAHEWSTKVVSLEEAMFMEREHSNNDKHKWLDSLEKACHEQQASLQEWGRRSDDIFKKWDANSSKLSLFLLHWK